MYKALYSYDFVLKPNNMEVPNNNDSKDVASNYVLNEAPNRNDTMGVANNVRLTIMGSIQSSMAAVYLVIIQKSDLAEMRDNDTKITKRCVDGNKHYPVK